MGIAALVLFIGGRHEVSIAATALAAYLRWVNLTWQKD
jgi:hypothetical protein